MLIEKFVIAGAAFEASRDKTWVPAIFRRPIITPEQIKEVTLGRGKASVEPPVCQGSGRGGGVPKPTLAVFRAEISNDAVGFPNHQPVIIYDRNSAMWIHRAKRGCIQPARVSARVDMVMVEFKLAISLHRLLDVKCATAPPNFQHHQTPLWFMVSKHG